MTLRQLAVAFCLAMMSSGAGGAAEDAGNEVVAPTDSPHLLMPHSNNEAGLWLSPSWRSAVAHFRAQNASMKRTSAESLDSSSHVKACASACGAGGTCNIFTGRHVDRRRPPPPPPPPYPPTHPHPAHCCLHRQQRSLIMP